MCSRETHKFLPSLILCLRTAPVRNCWHLRPFPPSSSWQHTSVRGGLQRNWKNGENILKLLFKGRLKVHWPGKVNIVKAFPPVPACSDSTQLSDRKRQINPKKLQKHCKTFLQKGRLDEVPLLGDAKKNYDLPLLACDVTGLYKRMTWDKYCSIVIK